jgi:hypothetical protein
MNLMSGDSFLRVSHNENDLEPCAKRVFRVLEDRLCDDAETIAVATAAILCFANPMEWAMSDDLTPNPFPKGKGSKIKESRSALTALSHVADSLARLRYAPPSVLYARRRLLSPAPLRLVWLTAPH